MVYGGENKQVFCIHQLGQLGSGKILIHHSGYAVEIAVAVFCYGHAAAAAGDDNEIIIQQGADRVLFHNVDRFGRGHDLPPAAARVLDESDAWVFLHQLGGGFAVIKSADGLGGV